VRRRVEKKDRPPPLGLIAQLLSSDNLSAACESGSYCAVAAILMWMKLRDTKVGVTLGLSLLRVAVQENCPQILKALLQALGTTLMNIRPPEVLPMVKHAAKAGNRNVVRWLLDSTSGSQFRMKDVLEAWLLVANTAEKQLPSTG
jgi:hypothetical protein